MLKLIAQYPRAFVMAILFHVLVAGIFLINFQFSHKPDVGRKKVDVVQATTVEASKVQAELDKLKAQEEKKRQSELARIKKLEREVEKAKNKRIKEQKRLKALERKRKREAEKKKKLEKERKKAEKKRKAEEKKRKLAEKKRKIAEEKRKKAEKAAKRAEQKRLKEIKRQREAEAKRKEEEKRRKQAEAERKQAEERARKAREAERLRAEEARERQRELDAENKRLEASRAQKVINKYVGLIAKQVKNSWRKPATANGNMSCDVDVTMMPSGDVLKVKARNCVGGELFKRSVEDAVYAAAPLALPPDSALFQYFRKITFKFNPN